MPQRCITPSLQHQKAAPVTTLRTFSSQEMETAILSILDKLGKDIQVKKISTAYNLPSGLSCVVDDYRTKRIDDVYYSKTKSLLLRRGLAAIYLPRIERDKPVFLLAGMPKFGYINDSFIPPLTGCGPLERRVYTVKENGEAGHLAFFQHPVTSRWFAVIGSKNVHIVISVDSEEAARRDLEYYEAMDQQRLNAVVANASLLLRFQSENLLKNSDLRQYLASKHLTIVFEAIFDNHIVSYGRHTLIAFAVTSPQFKPLEIQGLCELPETCLEKLRNWGFPVPEFDVVTEESYEAMDRKYETMFNVEGAVVYEVYTNVASGQPIIGKIYKHKNHVYIIQRMARELIKRRAPADDWKRRIGHIHIELTAQLKAEIDLLYGYSDWLETKKRREMRIPWAAAVQENFKDWYQQFKVANANVRPVKPLSSNLEVSQTAQGVETSAVAVMIVGLMGSGKTLLRNSLYDILGPSKAAYVNQDELGGQRRAFINELRHLAKKPGRIVVIDKCNDSSFVRNDVYSAYSKIVICEFYHPNPDELIDFCTERIRNRGADHPTLPFSPLARRILEERYDNYEPITEAERMANDYVALDITERPEFNVKLILDYLSKNGYLPWFEFKGNLTELAKRIEQVKVKYDTFARRQAIKRVKYWRASADPDYIREIAKSLVPKSNSIVYKWEMEPSAFSRDCRCRTFEEYHVTLRYDTLPTEEEAEKWLKQPELTVRAESIVYNENCAAIKIVRARRITELCEKKFPHITLGWAKGFQPFYACTMLDNGLPYTEVPCDFEIDLVINPVL